MPIDAYAGVRAVIEVSASVYPDAITDTSLTAPSGTVAEVAWTRS